MDRERSQFRAYLLGALPEAEAAELDEQLFKSEDVLRRVEDEQQALVEESAKGLLSAAEEARFRAQCARSPELKRNLAEVETLIGVLEERSSRVRQAQPSRVWSRFLVMLSPALAVALCVAAFLLVQQRRVSGDLQRRLDAMEAAPIAPAVAAEPIPEGKPFVAFLAANVVRGGGSTPRVIVPKGAATVELQVEVRGAGAGTEAWHVAIVENGQPVWMSARVPVRRVGPETFLDLRIDAGVLTPGVYTVQLGTAASGSEQTRQFVVGGGQ